MKEIEIRCVVDAVYSSEHKCHVSALVPIDGHMLDDYHGRHIYTIIQVNDE